MAGDKKKAGIGAGIIILGGLLFWGLSRSKSATAATEAASGAQSLAEKIAAGRATEAELQSNLQKTREQIAAAVSEGVSEGFTGKTASTISQAVIQSSTGASARPTGTALYEAERAELMEMAEYYRQSYIADPTSAEGQAAYKQSEIARYLELVLNNAQYGAMSAEGQAASQKQADTIAYLEDALATGLSVDQVRWALQTGDLWAHAVAPSGYWTGWSQAAAREAAKGVTGANLVFDQAWGWGYQVGDLITYKQGKVHTEKGIQVTIPEGEIFTEEEISAEVSPSTILAAVLAAGGNPQAAQQASTSPSMLAVVSANPEGYWSTEAYGAEYPYYVL